MPFSFHDYLFTLTPHQKWIVSAPFKTGYVNTTVRATKMAPNYLGKDGQDKYFPGRHSIILKHAPPWIAALGPQALMPEERQDIEALALELFSSDILQQTTKDHGISLPTLLHHDQMSRILILSDLGLRQTLSEYLFSLRNDTFHEESDTNPSDSVLSPKTKEAMDSFAKRLGVFLATLHSPAVRLSYRGPGKPFPMPVTLSEKYIGDIASFLVIHLGMFDQLQIPVAEATLPELVERVTQRILALRPKGDMAFAHGDLSTGALLVNASDFEDETPSSTSDQEEPEHRVLSVDEMSMDLPFRNSSIFNNSTQNRVLSVDEMLVDPFPSSFATPTDSTQRQVLSVDEMLVDSSPPSIATPSDSTTSDTTLGPFTPESDSSTLGPSVPLPPPLTGIIDWEFATPGGRALSGDFSQLLAILRLHLLAFEPGSKAHAATSGITHSLKAAYISVYLRDRPEWLVWMQDTKDGFPRPPPASSSIALTLRDMFLKVGCEMINNAVWKDWGPCRCCAEARAIKGTLSQAQKRSCQVVRRMVEMGAWYLCRAGKDVQAFVEVEAWEATWAEEGYLERLFLLPG